MKETVFFNLSIANYYGGVNEFDIYRISDIAGDSAIKKKAKILSFEAYRNKLSSQKKSVRFVR